jgi:two-component system NarL family response regulator
MIRILLADEHQLFRQALRILLRKEAAMQIVAETGDPVSLKKLACETRPDVICMDGEFAGADAVQNARRVLAVCPDAKVIVVAAFPDRNNLFDLLDAGASAYVTKAAVSDELVRAIRAAQNGRKYVCAEVIAPLLLAVLDKSGQQDDLGVTGLGARERQVLRLLAAGYSGSHISALLGISQSTVEVHQRNLARKLNLRGVDELTRFANSRCLAQG